MRLLAGRLGVRFEVEAPREVVRDLVEGLWLSKNARPAAAVGCCGPPCELGSSGYFGSPSSRKQVFVPRSICAWRAALMT